ncbi:collagen-like protein [Candidatus Pacearchaeota archaeon]|nr:collagen-like protein [Candidatus Pacearchaeota archaeon]
MKYAKIVFFIMLVGLFSCAGTPGKDGTNGTDGQSGVNGVDGINGEDGADGTDGNDSTTDTVIVFNPSGYAEAASCLGFGVVDMFELDAGLRQTAYYRGETAADNTGHYTIPAVVSSEYVLYGADVDCRRETTNGTVNIKMRLLTTPSAEDRNINIPGTIKTFVAQAHYVDSEHENYGNIAGSLASSQAEVLAFFGMPDAGMDFEEMSIQGDSTGDAVMTLISATVDFNNTGPEQGNLMKQIAEGILNNDEALKTNVNLITDRLPIIAIKNNIDSMFVELGISATSPSIWFNAPDYYADLLEREPIVTSSFNLDDNTNCSFDQSTYNLFANPVTFPAGIELSKYIALNFPPDIELSVWTVGIDGNGNPAPGIELLTIAALDEIILTDPVPMTYNGLLGDNHGLLPDTQYYFRIRKDTDFTLSKSCGGDRLYTAYTLASDDEGETWIGDGNNADRFFYFTGIKGYTIN